MSCFPTLENSNTLAEVTHISRKMGISLQEAWYVKQAFELAFDDEELRGRIYHMMDELDRRAAENDEPACLKVRFAVELGSEGFSVMRGTEIMLPGEKALPDGRVEVFCRINEGFPTDKWLGPLALKRPEPETYTTQKSIPAEDLPKETSDSDGGWPRHLLGYHPYRPPQFIDSRRGPSRIRRLANSTSAPLLGETDALPVGAFSGASAGATSGVASGASTGIVVDADPQSSQTSSGASPPATFGDHGHSGRESCPLPITLDCQGT